MINPTPTGVVQPQGFDLMDTLGQIAGGVGNYYLGQENIQDVEELGRQSQEQLTALGQQMAEQAEFRPFTVTTGLGTTTTDPTGGVSVGLTPEQQALQNQLLSQATGLFGQVGVSPAEAQADIYEQIRATQRPEEERQRLAMEERLLSQGRLGLQSAAYGGSSPELLAMETARQEAMARAGLSARQQAMAEQQQALSAASGLMGLGYMPQREALNVFNVASIAPQLSQRGQLSGVELQSQLAQSGLEANLGMMDLASRLRQQRDRGLMETLMGRQPTLQEQALGQYVGLDPEDLIKEGLINQGLNWLFGGSGSSSGGGGGTSMLNPTEGLTPTNVGDMTTEQFLNIISPPASGSGATTPTNIGDMTNEQFLELLQQSQENTYTTMPVDLGGGN